MIQFVILNLIISNGLIRNINFVSVHSLLNYIKDLISLNLNNLYVLHYNDILVSKWWSMLFNGVVRGKIHILLEAILIPTH